MTQAPHELDVRRIPRVGGEPLKSIIEAVDGLASGQALRLLATFEPVPLYRLLAKKGFDHAAREIGGGDWEVLFTPAATAVDAPPSASARPTAPGSSTSAWPAPVRQLDHRDLDPPEPMVRTLAAVEELRPGEALSVLLCREPVFLLPELHSRGCELIGGFEEDGTTFRLLVRKAVAKEAAE